MHTKKQRLYKCYWYTPTVNHYTMHKKQRVYKCYWYTPTVNHYTMHKKTKIIQMLLIYTDSQPLYNAQKNKGTHKCYWYTPTVNHFTMHKKQRTYKCYWDTPTVNHYTVHKKTKSIQMLLIYTSSQPLYNAQKNKEYINVTDIRQQSTMPLEFLKKIEKNRFSEKKTFKLFSPMLPPGFPWVSSKMFSCLASYSQHICNMYHKYIWTKS